EVYYDAPIISDSLFANLLDLRTQVSRKKRRNTLLTVQHILHFHPIWRVRNAQVTNVFYVVNTLICLPKNKGSYWITLQNAVQQLGCFINCPDKIPLKLGDFDNTFLDFMN